MIWAVLALVGVPLWLCALGIVALVYRNKSLRKRHGDITVRVQRAGKTRRTRGHAVWVSDVFAWRGTPAAWSEDLFQVVDARVGASEPKELKKLYRLGGVLRNASSMGLDWCDYTTASPASPARPRRWPKRAGARRRAPTFSRPSLRSARV